VDGGDGAALSGEEGFFDEPKGVAAAEGFPIEAVGSVETDFGFRGWAVGPLSGAEEDVHPFGFGNPIRMRDDDCEMRSGFELPGAADKDSVGGGCPPTHAECDHDSIIRDRWRKPDDVFRVAMPGSARGLEALGSDSHKVNDSVRLYGGQNMRVEMLWASGRFFLEHP
jgi:hypothetical protein